MRVAVALAVIAIAVYSFVLRWRILDATPFPTGIDGYFYPLQLRALLAHGHLQYPASPLAFWFMAPFAALTDPIVGAKLGAAIGGALAALPAYALGARLGRGRGAGLVAAALTVFSAGSTYLTIEYVKNGIGITVALTALWLVLRAIPAPASDAGAAGTVSRGRLVAAVLAIVAALLAHKMAAALVIAIGLPAALAASIGRGKLRGRRLIYLAIGAAIAAMVLLLAGVLAPRRFLSPEDLRLAHGLFSNDPEWELPALSVHGYVLDLDHEALTGAVLAIAAAIALVLRGRLAPAERTIAWGAIALGAVIAIPFLAVDDPMGLGFRLRLVAFVPRALCAAVICGVLPVPRRDTWIAIALGAVIATPFLAVAASNGFGVWMRLVALAPHALYAAVICGGVLLLRRDIALAALALVIALAAPREDHVDGEILAHPALVTSALALRGQLGDGETAIVPERHIEFMIAWYADVSVSARPGGIDRDKRRRVLPGNFIVLGSPLDKALTAARAEPSLTPPIGVHPRHANGMVVVTEATWEWVLDHLPPRSREHFAAWITK